MRNLTTILFDFDGTLADTLPICIHAIQQAFLTYDGQTLTPGEVVAMFGPTEADIIRLNLRNREAAEDGVRLFYKLYNEEHDVRVKPNEAILGLLGHLKSKGYRMGIVTGKGRDSLDISLDRLGMTDYFDVTVSGDEMTKPKPDPEGVLTAMQALGAEKDETLFIGDSEADMRAGKGAGVFTIGAHWLENVQTHEFGTMPDLYVKRVAELLAFLETA
ncbi:HAD family hydrolase [Paenibacillus ginsengarvi]|uniref:HAD family hydrolase n=1 Tax=Paenibacillus ginsengarvi TaxID=400777 RepID=A0A3B0CSS0_9BACL|nr:HAD family hydrolase [Paenibacillus ginsengarvi]RKN86574.1 HAD family hydrolase [Paenibacillus ginsengarvi]